MLLLQEFAVKGDTPGEVSREASYRFIFDITFFILITTIGLNIVFGIIIDTFSELREARVRELIIMTDQLNIPFILVQCRSRHEEHLFYL